jgi:hypothetical protein
MKKSYQCQLFFYRIVSFTPFHPLCISLHPFCISLHPLCTSLHPPAPHCTLLHLIAPCCTPLHLNALTLPQCNAPGRAVCNGSGLTVMCYLSAAW